MTLRFRRHNTLTRQRGVTLLEMLVVLAIIALTLLVVAPSFSGAGDRASLEKMARVIAAALNDSRTLAIRRNTEIIFTIDLDKREISVKGSRTHAYADDIEINIVAARSEMISESQPSIRFFPDGSSTGGEITVHRKNAAYHITVDWLTGAIDVERMSSNEP